MQRFAVIYPYAKTSRYGLRAHDGKHEARKLPLGGQRVLPRKDLVVGRRDRQCFRMRVPEADAVQAAFEFLVSFSGRTSWIELDPGPC